MKPNGTTIVLSIVFSIVLWIFVSFSGQYTTTINVPIEFTNFLQDHTIQSQSTTEASLVLQGEGWALAQVTMGPDNKLEVSTNEKAGEQIVRLRDVLSQNPWLTSSLQVVRVNPDQLDFSIERINYKTVPIIPNISIEAQEDYELVSEVILEPDSVLVMGPQSIIRKMNAVITRSVVYEGIDDKVVENIELEPINHITYSNSKCLIEFDVQKIVDKTFDEVPVEVVGAPPFRELSLFPSKLNVTLRGGIKMLGMLKKDEIIAYVNFQEAIKDTMGLVEPIIKIPEYTKISNVEPKSLNYVIKQY